MGTLLLKILIIILTNAGGTGKTHVTELIECLARFAGMSVRVIDADQGCRGYRNRNGSGNAVTLDWAAGETPPPVWFDQHLAPVDVSIIDLGANFLSMDTPAGSFLNDIVEIARKQGIRTVFMPIDSPDKAGARALAERLYSQFSNNFEVILIKNDNRGTDNFGVSRIIDPPTLHIPYLQAGYEAIRLRQARRLDEVITCPEPGYTIASAAMADRLLQVAHDRYVQKLFGSAMLAPLKDAAEGRPGPLTYAVAKPADASDEALRANMAVTAATIRLNRVPRGDAQARLAAFEAELEANERYHKT